MRKKIIASRPNKENERPPLGPRRTLKEQCGWGKDGGSHGRVVTPQAKFLQQQIQQKIVEKLEHINKRWQAEAMIADKDVALADKDAALADKDAALLAIESQNRKLLEMLKAAGISPPK